MKSDPVTSDLWFAVLDHLIEWKPVTAARMLKATSLRSLIDKKAEMLIRAEWDLVKLGMPVDEAREIILAQMLPPPNEEAEEADEETVSSLLAYREKMQLKRSDLETTS